MAFEFQAGDIVRYNIAGGATAEILEFAFAQNGLHYYKIKLIPIHNGTDNFDLAHHQELVLVRHKQEEQ